MRIHLNIALWYFCLFWQGMFSSSISQRPCTEIVKDKDDICITSIAIVQTISTDDQTMEAYDHQLTAIFQSALLLPPPTLPAPRSPFFLHAEEVEEWARSDHTYRSRPPPSTPSLQFPRHLCMSLRPQLNNKALNLCGGVNPSLEKERKRQRKEVKGERERGWGVRGWGRGVNEEGEVRKSESEMPWNLITQRVVSGRGGEQIKLA